MSINKNIGVRLIMLEPLCNTFEKEIEENGYVLVKYKREYIKVIKE